MLRSLWLLFLYVSFVGLSIQAPFIATLGYVWVDTFQPQSVAYIILNQIPVALIMGAIAVFGWLALDRRSPPPMNLQTALQVCMLVWTTATLIWAQAPQAAVDKWDVVWKTLAFATFIPYAIRSRVHIEAFAQTYVFSLAANFVPFGLKVLISGGGYGQNLGLQGGNSGLSEGGYLSTVCLMAVPLAFCLARHSQLIPKHTLITLAYWGIAIMAIACAIGTYERSALVGLVVLGIYMWARSQNKFALGLVLAVATVAALYTSSGGWNSRVSTIGNYDKEDSALGRILVWRWTMEFTATHPLGGGFSSHVVDHIEMPGHDGQAPYIIFGKAFHSIYFEVLGEHGYPGLAIFLTLILSTFLVLHRTSKRASRHPELQWARALSDALQCGLAVFLSSGAFVGIAFQPPFWYFISMAISLRAYVDRAEAGQGAALTGWRPSQAAARPAPDMLVAAGGWRQRHPVPIRAPAAVGKPR